MMHVIPYKIYLFSESQITLRQSPPGAAVPAQAYTKHGILKLGIFGETSANLISPKLLISTSLLLTVLTITRTLALYVEQQNKCSLT